MSSFILSPGDFQVFNGFYKKPECREIVYRLYMQKCQGCRTDLSDREDYVSGHILATRHAELFVQLFPGLDVNNLLNLHLLCQACNVRQSAYHFDSPFFLNQVFKESARAIELRYSKVEAELRVGKEDPETIAVQAWIARLETECKDLLKSVRLERAAIFKLSGETWSRVTTLADTVLRDRKGRLAAAASNMKGVVWAVTFNRTILTGEALASTPRPVTENQSEIMAWFDANPTCHYAALRQPLVDLLKAINSGIRAIRRSEFRGGAINWEETERSKASARLAAAGAASMEFGGGHLFSAYLASFAIIPFESLAHLERDGWIGWQKKDVDDALKTIGAALGEFTHDQTFWLLAEAARITETEARLERGRMLSHSSRQETFPLFPHPVETGLWWNAQHVRENKGLIVPRFEAINQARLQVLFHLNELSQASVDEDGVVSAFRNRSWDSLLLRLGRKNRELGLQNPVQQVSRANGYGTLNLEALERMTSHLPNILSVVRKEDAWEGMRDGRMPWHLKKQVARYLRESELTKISISL